MAYVINKETCLGCGACVAQCGQGAIEEAGDKYRIKQEKCTDCGACVGFCPVQAISKEN
ncbi:ferredoxin [Candidatus Saganbacteria bacterium CG08_land_8_20_14_0_20_45_16]|uniref:Ferredoxin n=1 Tax=Candidatus Saganbacteria bacterium CG08_land_8_20_14_0_20_45_16 TaxID=2014293 RepID=A0A2H0XVG2_UNCSA|nr:MAG: ferredoxin [Candidatus Saganbacteria bacterium CG08_land_8_20_14_0_20_45_16]